MNQEDKLRNWENVLRENGYTNEDIIKITMSILKVYEYGKKQGAMKKKPQTSSSRRKPPGGPNVDIDTIELPEPDDRNVMIKLSLLQKISKYIRDKKTTQGD